MAVTSAPDRDVMAEKAHRGGIKAAAANAKLKRRVQGTFPARLVKSAKAGQT